MTDDASFGPSLAPEAWGDLYRSLVDAPRDDMSPDDWRALAVSAYLIGDDDTCTTAWEAAHRLLVDAGERAEAARCSFWLAFCLMLRGQMAHAGAWLNRTRGVIGDDLECAASGYLLIPALLEAIGSDGAVQARELAQRAQQIAEQFDDHDLAAFAKLGGGQALIALGETDAGLVSLDEAMLSVEAGEVGPIASGIVYCAVILECMQLLDLQRAAEWTGSLDAWCRRQPELVPFRGQCLVHQSQLLQAAGDWTEASAVATRARDRLTDPPHPALGLACYQEGQLLRLRGALDDAAEAYARASIAGHEPMPGSALLDLQRGDVDGASAAISRVLLEPAPKFRRAELLEAAVEVFRAAGDPSAARRAAEELVEIAAGESSLMLEAIASRALGWVMLDEGDAADALAELRASAARWKKLDIPYEVARTRVLVGLACESLDDDVSARRELADARGVFESLGAGPDLVAVGTHFERLEPSEPVGEGRGNLSSRELEVLAEVAAGKTNPEIAAALTISQHTVGRHLENIFSKLGVRSRAAATAHAYEHGLL